jgi:superfamily I DNA/RNA helicase
MSFLRVGTDLWRPVGVESLEDRALSVVRSTEDRAVIAGPGAGKTELLAQRASFLLQTNSAPSPRRILAISFKRDAAVNLKARVALRCSPEDAGRFDSLTFDAFAKNLLDRFRPGLPQEWRPTADYEILFPTFRTFQDFLNSLSGAPIDLGGNRAIPSIPRQSFERDAVLGIRLAENGIPLSNIKNWAASIWWADSLHKGSHSRLTFGMIGRLAELILRVNPLARSALAMTYSHVFMDEFQDTTQVQFDLIETAFRGTRAVVTAVGDNKQQIMRWAMALADAFDVFERAFPAKRVKLLNNYRSSPDLVRIQHVLARAIDEDTEESSSQTSSDISGESCAIWEFRTRKSEAQHLADVVKTSIDAGRNPRDVVVLVRQKANEYEELLGPAFKAVGLNLRNEARMIGKLMLQDLLADHLVSIGLRMLRVATMRSAGRVWSKLVFDFQTIHGALTSDDAPSDAIEQLLDRASKELVSKWPSPSCVGSAKDLVEFLISVIGRDQLVGAFPEYRQGDWLKSVTDSMATQLELSCAGFDTWKAALDDFEGVDSVPLMTVHKSKGLEYHTVIFVGLDDSAWWSFKSDPAEGRSTFFVAFSRAKQRVLFTFCEENGNHDNISSLYDLLESAGVKTYAM